MNASVFALLCVAVFASNPEQFQQAFLASFEEDIGGFANAYLSRAEFIESFVISQLYPDNADQIMAEVQECQDQDVDLLPTVIKGVVADLDELVQACARGSVTEAIEKIIKDSTMVVKGVFAGCPNITVSLDGDIGQLSAALTAKILGGLQSPLQAGVEQTGGKVDEATFQKTGQDTKAALSAIHQAFAAAQAGNLTPDLLTAALNDSLLLVSDSSSAFTDVAPDTLEKAIEVASTACGLVTSIFTVVQGAGEVKGN